MISVIITTYNEPESLYRAIEAIFNENLSDFEVLVVGPDIKTEKVVKDFQKKFSNIFYLKDEAKGKPAALNLAFKKARGKILIFKSTTNPFYKPFLLTDFSHLFSLRLIFLRSVKSAFGGIPTGSGLFNRANSHIRQISEFLLIV